MDERQYEDNSGPCLHAAASGELISIDDMTADTTYPEFSRQACRHGVRCLLAVGIPALENMSAAINFYSFGTPGAFDDTIREIAVTFADFAGVAFLNDAVYEGAFAEVAQLRQAMASRAGIEQAKGRHHGSDQMMWLPCMKSCGYAS